MPHSLLLTVERPSRLIKEATVGVCCVLTVIRDEELSSRRRKMQTVKQSRRQRWVYREANEGYKAASMVLDRELAFGFIGSFIFVKFSKVY